MRTFVSVDGGMGDNIRPALYGAQYEAMVANHVTQAATRTVTIAGKYCESGDILVQDAQIAPVSSGRHHRHPRFRRLRPLNGQLL